MQSLRTASCPGEQPEPGHSLPSRVLRLRDPSGETQQGLGFVSVGTSLLCRAALPLPPHHEHSSSRAAQPHSNQPKSCLYPHPELCLVPHFTVLPGEEDYCSWNGISVDAELSGPETRDYASKKTLRLVVEFLEILTAYPLH